MNDLDQLQLSVMVVPSVMARRAHRKEMANLYAHFMREARVCEQMIKEYHHDVENRRVRSQ